jgi:uncharacterized protein YndB with AHSA1/START domain
MIDFTVETPIERPAHEVFAYVTDPGKLATWQTNTVSSIPEQPGPIGLGTRLREVHRGPGGKEFPSLVEVVEFDPGRRFSLRVIEGTPVHADMTFEPTPTGGTVLRFRAHGRLTGPTRLAEPFLGRMLRKQFTQQCAALKHVLEDDADGPGVERASA